MYEYWRMTKVEPPSPFRHRDTCWPDLAFQPPFETSCCSCATNKPTPRHLRKEHCYPLEDFARLLLSLFYYQFNFVLAGVRLISAMDRSLKCFTNCLICMSGELIAQDLYFSEETGLITPNYYFRQEGVERIDLDGKVVAPGYLDLQTNGMKGVHFTQLAEKDVLEGDERQLHEVSRAEASHGVTAWWATVPTVDVGRWKQVGSVSRSQFEGDRTPGLEWQSLTSISSLASGIIPTNF